MTTSTPTTSTIIDADAWLGKHFEGVENDQDSVAAATERALEALTSNPPKRQAAADRLAKLQGVQVPTASAILTIAYPEMASVIDDPAIHTLCANGELRRATDRWSRIIGARPSWPLARTKVEVKEYRDSRTPDIAAVSTTDTRP